MAFDFGVIKKHWMLIGIVAVVGFVGFLLLNSGGGGTTTVTTGASDAEVQAGTSLQLAQLSAAQASNQQNFQLAYLQQQQGGDLALATLQAQLQQSSDLNNTTASQNIANWTLSTQQVLGLDSNATNRYIVDSNNQASVSQSQIAANTNIQLAAYQTAGAIQMAQIQGDTTLGLANIVGQTQQTLAQYNAAVGINQSNNAAQVAITQSNNNLSATKNTNKTSTTNGIIGTIASLAGLFI